MTGTGTIVGTRVYVEGGLPRWPLFRPHGEQGVMVSSVDYTDPERIASLMKTLRDRLAKHFESDYSRKMGMELKEKHAVDEHGLAWGMLYSNAGNLQRHYPVMQIRRTVSKRGEIGYEAKFEEAGMFEVNMFTKHFWPSWSRRKMQDMYNTTRKTVMEYLDVEPKILEDTRVLRAGFQAMVWNGGQLALGGAFYSFICGLGPLPGAILAGAGGVAMTLIPLITSGEARADYSMSAIDTLREGSGERVKR